ncbi:MAG: complex I subunit 1 family protein [Thermacetogeniaceae bacterium]|jgi:formate hydrogenlyase subunit 4
MNPWIIAIVTVIVAPFIGGILAGIDRRITARLQGRFGPPIIQPFYDLFKLLGKNRIAVNWLQFMWIYFYLVLMITALLFLVLRLDILLMMFILGFAGVSFALGGFCSKSPYSHLGANRELMQMLAYEPVLLLLALGVYAQNGSFMISQIYASSTPLIARLWPIFIALLVILTIKLRKSPFDIATSHHAHQELIKGVMTEYSGPYYALINLTEWYEIVLLLAIVSLFVANPLWVGIVIALAAYVLEMFVDNIAARMTVGWMVRFVWAVGITLCILNLIWFWVFAAIKGVS